jgi:hypothetical protein
LLLQDKRAWRSEDGSRQLSDDVNRSAAAVNVPQGGRASGQIDVMSCASAGNCTAVGYMKPPIRTILFIVTEKGGVWGTAQPVPGLASLPDYTRGGQFNDMSCPSAGNCGAGGTYAVAGHDEVFLVSEKHGFWGKAQEVPGLAKLTVGGAADISQVMCPSAGNCVGVGVFGGKNGDTRPFAVTEHNGSWGSVRTFPRITARSPDRQAYFGEVWCGSVSDCVAYGAYSVSPNQDVGFFINEKNGIWGPPATPGADIRAPERGKITGSGHIAGSSDDYLWCVSPGNCTAGGNSNSSPDPESFQPAVITETNGKWGKAQALPGVSELSANSGMAALGGIACLSAGDCTAVGFVIDANSAGDVIFLSTEKNGVWGEATELAGLPAPPAGKPLSLSDPVLACGGKGDCALGGWYSTALYPFTPYYAYLATEKNGVWGSAQPVK